MKAAIQKYGKENFTIEEIGGANSESELNYIEWLAIEVNNCIAPNGYNLKQGGDSMRQTEASKLKIGKSNSISIVDCSTGIIYDSASQASRELKTQQSHISACVNGQLNTHLGKVFKKTSEWDGVLISITSRRKKVIETTTGILYLSARDAADKLKIKYSGVKSAATGKQKQHKGYTFKYIDSKEAA